MRVKLPSLTLDPEGARRAEGVDKTFDFSPFGRRPSVPFSSLFAFAHQAKAVTFVRQRGQ